MLGWASLEWICSSVTNCDASAMVTRTWLRSAHLLCQLGGLHLGLDDLQSDCTAAKVLMAQQLCAVADGEATLSQLRSRLILQAFGVAHHLWWRLSVDGRSRHSKIGRSNVDGRGGVSAGVEHRAQAKQPCFLSECRLHRRFPGNCQASASLSPPSPCACRFTHDALLVRQFHPMCVYQ